MRTEDLLSRLKSMVVIILVAKPAGPNGWYKNVSWLVTDFIMDCASWILDC